MARRSTRVALSITAAIAATYGAERWTVARWSSGPDEYRHEPRTLTGTARYIPSGDGTELHVIESGEGPTAVLAHGFTATAHHWAPVASRLVDAGFRVVAFDQRGHGRSAAVNDTFGAAQLAADLTAVVTAAAPDGAVIAGHSMGGIGIQAMLAHHPAMVERLHGIVLIATLARPVSVPLGRLMSRLGGTALARWMMAHRIHGRILARGGLGRDPAVTILDVVRHGWASCPDDTRAAVMNDLRDYDFSAVLEATPVPTTVVCGDLDQVTPLAESERMAGLLPNGRLEVIPTVGHSVPWEAADRVAQIIAAHAPSTLMPGDST